MSENENKTEKIQAKGVIDAPNRSLDVFHVASDSMLVGSLCPKCSMRIEAGQYVVIDTLTMHADCASA